jgi:hypothetical protein
MILEISSRFRYAVHDSAFLDFEASLRHPEHRVYAVSHRVMSSELVAFRQTLASWSTEIAAMWRFTKNNGITERFTTKWNSSIDKLTAFAISKITVFASRYYVDDQLGF